MNLILLLNARIYGFEIDSKEILEKETCLKFIMKFIDDNDVVRDTGKIIYAHMNVNNREISI